MAWDAVTALAETSSQLKVERRREGKILTSPMVRVRHRTNPETTSAMIATSLIKVNGSEFIAYSGFHVVIGGCLLPVELLVCPQ